MQVWPVLTILCSAAAVALAYPLIRRFESASQRAEREAAIYESQLAEVQTDAAAGNISDSDAELAKSEIQRRLAAVQKTVETQRPVPSPWRGVAIASTAGLLILGSVNLYLVLGRPDLNSVPSPAVASASSTASVSQAEMVNTTPADNAAAAAGGAGQVTDMVSKLAERLKSQPNDAEGWRMLGWSYFNLQNYAQSAEAYKRALALDPGNIDYKSSYAEALVQAAGGHRHNLIKTVVYLTDVADKDEVGRARRDFFAGHYPVSTLVVVKALVFPQLCVEIDAWARLDLDLRQAS